MCEIIAMSIYTDKFGSSDSYGWSYILGWIASVVTAAAAVLSIVFGTEWQTYCIAYLSFGFRNEEEMELLWIFVNLYARKSQILRLLECLKNIMLYLPLITILKNLLFVKILRNSVSNCNFFYSISE